MGVRSPFLKQDLVVDTAAGRAGRESKAGFALALGVGPWLAAYAGAYLLHSAVAAFAFYHLLCLSAATHYHVRYGKRAHVALPHVRWAGLAVAGLTICVATYSAMGLIGTLIEPARVSRALHALGIPVNQGAIVALFVYFAAVNPYAEELFWRGTVYLRLRAASWSVPAAGLASAILFGSWHWLIVRLFFAPVMACLVTAGIICVGYIFARLYERLGSLPALILIHALAADVPVLIALWFGVLAKG